MNHSKISFVLFSICFSLSLHASDMRDKIKRFDWNGIDVVWLEEEQFPMYTIVTYFADGSLSDSNGEFGTTNAMFNLLPSGTRRYGQKDITDYLEFYGTGVDVNVTHEYSTYSVSGLAKDVIPTMKQICQLFADATFPANEIEKEKRRAVENLKNMVNDHSGLATKIFRELSMQNTPYSYPTMGKIKDVQRFNQKQLRRKLDYFNAKVKKRIYITGPQDVLQVKSIINEECGWKGVEDDYIRHTNYEQSPDKPRVVFVTVPNANQAQIRMGRFLNREQISRPDLLTMSSSFLGGGFTSKLMRAVRFKEGLTYSIGAVAAGQKEYGRSFISTFTKNGTVPQLLDVVKNTLEEIKQNKFTDEEFELARGYLVESYPFGFETNDAYLAQIISLEHEGRSLDEIYDFPDKIKKIKRDEIVKNLSMLFPWEQMTIMILGDKSVANELKKSMSLEQHDYIEFL